MITCRRIALAFAATAFALPSALFGQNPASAPTSRQTRQVPEELYRIDDGRQSIRVWKRDAGYGGQVVSYFATYVDWNERQAKKAKTISKEASLTEETAKAVFLKSKELDRVPDMSKIPGWEIGFDGVLYQISHSTEGVSTQRKYWTPAAQKDATPYKKEILAFVEFVYRGTNLQRHFDELLRIQPVGKYTDGFRVWTISGDRQREGGKAATR
jgi:hypothetical protein